MKVQQGIREAEISAVVTRADGTVEDLGVISYWHKNSVMRVMKRLEKGLKAWRRS